MDAGEPSSYTEKGARKAVHDEGHRLLSVQEGEEQKGASRGEYPVPVQSSTLVESATTLATSREMAI